MTKHLWEIDHPYYGPEGNYFANWTQTEPYNNRFESWEEFVKSGFPELDKDMNLLFRWDWKPASEEYERNHDELRLFYVLQRKATFLYATIKVEREDELAVRQFLFEYWGHMRLLWEGVSDL